MKKRKLELIEPEDVKGWLRKELQSADVVEAMIEFVEERRERGGRMSLRATKMACRRLGKLTSVPQYAIEIIEQSIFREWDGLFHVKQDEGKSSPPPPLPMPEQMPTTPAGRMIAQITLGIFKLKGCSDEEKTRFFVQKHSEAVTDAERECVCNFVEHYEEWRGDPAQQKAGFRSGIKAPGGSTAGVRREAATEEEEKEFRIQNGSTQYGF